MTLTFYKYGEKYGETPVIKQQKYLVSFFKIIMLCVV